MSVIPRAAVESPLSVKVRYRSFVERHDVAWELFFAALAVFFVSLAFVPAEPGSEEEATLYAIEWLVTGIFIAEFGSRLWAAQSRRTYLRGHIVDLISCIPPARWLRWFRLLRLLRLIRAFAGVGRAMTHVNRLANHRGLLWLVVAWSAVMLLCSVGLYAAENGTNKAIDSPLDALWWGITTMTTVGYGDVIPVTSEGRIAAGILMLLGIGLYSAITATVTSFLISSGQSTDLATQLERLSVLHIDGHLSDDEYLRAKSRLIDPTIEAVNT
ncbi:MAG: potassium channel family protein [Chloroflexota bacterium]